jgi:hypothetical protein
MAELRTLKVTPIIAGEVIVGEGIYDICVINVFYYKHLPRFSKYLIFCLFLKTKPTARELFGGDEETMCVDGSKMADGQRNSPSTLSSILIIWI